MQERLLQGCRACGDSRGSGYIFPERDRSCGGNSGKDTGDAAVLKEAGVVDSGGQGLLEVYHGAYDGSLAKRLIIHSLTRPKVLL